MESLRDVKRTMEREIQKGGVRCSLNGWNLEKSHSGS